MVAVKRLFKYAVLATVGTGGTGAQAGTNSGHSVSHIITTVSTPASTVVYSDKNHNAKKDVRGHVDGVVHQTHTGTLTDKHVVENTHHHEQLSTTVPRVKEA